MRYAALAFGVVAGLVASFILALGGLDAAAIFHADRPMQLASFGLYIVANLGVLGAGIVLAAPLVGAGLFLAGAIGWVGAAIFLRHGPDFVMLTPPGLLLVALAFSILAYLRRPHAAVPHMQTDDIDDEQDEDEEDEEDEEEEPEQRVGPTRRRAAPAPAPEELELPEVAVGAGFFGQGGTAMPLQPEAPPAPRPAPQRPVAQPYRPPQPQQQQTAQRPSPQFQARQAEPPPPAREPAQQVPLRSPADPQIRANENPDDWRPGRRRPAPPRATPMFRQPEDLEEEDEYEDEESGFSRFSRIAASILSFGLYAGLAGAAALVIWNTHGTGTGRATASKVDTASVAAVSSSATPASPVLSSSHEPASLATPPASVAAADVPAALSEFPPSDAGLALLAQPTDTAPPAATPAPASSEPELSVAAASEEPPQAEPVVPTVGAMMPDDMPARMAAERLKPAPRPTPPAPIATDTPLLLDSNTGL